MAYTRDHDYDKIRFKKILSVESPDKEHITFSFTDGTKQRFFVEGD